MREEVKVFLKHILESISLIETYTADISREDFLKSQQLQDSIIRRLEIIGEATKHLPAKFREQHPQVAWREIAGMRDMMIHEYFGIDLELTWKMVKDDLPALRKELSQILESQE